MKVYVYVLNKKGKPLMPTNPGKARLLLKQGKAKVVKRTPFTIQITEDIGETVQDTTLGIDSGYSNIGFSAITEKDELISGEVKLDNLMSKRLTDRAMYRRNRRSRNTRYRPARFNNRISSKKDGWLPPSINRRIETHEKIVKQIKIILPITEVIIEVGKFDIQKLQNLNIQGEDYQKGNLYEYHNLKSYIVAREKGKCQLCKKEKGSDSWNLHHIELRSKGGSDNPRNFALIHKLCHKKLHKKGLEGSLSKPKFYKDATFMNIMKGKLIELSDRTTFGYITYIKRLKLELEKSHANDAFCISEGSNQSRSKCYNVVQKRKHNRCLQKNRKGFKPSIRRVRYSLQPLDLVKYEGKEYRVKGVQNYGKYVKLNNAGNTIVKSVKKVNIVKHEGSSVWQ